jgi:hypothetical protein
MPVKKQTQKQSQIVQVIIGTAILDKLKKKRKPRKKKNKRKAKDDEADLREPYRRNNYMKPLKYKQTLPAYGGNNMIMQQTENQRNNRILSDLQQRINQYERLLKQKPNPTNKFIRKELLEEMEDEQVLEEIERQEDETTQELLKEMEDEEEMEEMEEREDQRQSQAERDEEEMEEMEEREVRPPDPVVTKQLIDDEPRTPPNEPEDLEPGSFGGRPEKLDPVQAEPVPEGEGTDFPVAEQAITQSFPPPPRTPSQEGKGAEEPELAVVEAEVMSEFKIPDITEWNARFNMLNPERKKQFKDEYGKTVIFRSTGGELKLRPDGSLKGSQTINLNDEDKIRMELQQKTKKLSIDLRTQARNFLTKLILEEKKEFDNKKKAEKKAKKKVIDV